MAFAQQEVLDTHRRGHDGIAAETLIAIPMTEIVSVA